MKYMDTEFELEHTLASAISEWFETGHVSVNKYPAKFHEAIWSQGAIGWRQIFNGKISRHWLGHQGHTKTSQGRLRMDYIWGANIVETCLRMMIDLWEMRKEEVYGKEEGTKQQIRKEKAATRVRELHKLQETARPSDAKLFYADMDRQIETSTAATLEGFVAMKTKSIHNSVKQWADTAKLGVKSLIGWIRTGGKNNREIIDRTENRQRTQFKNEQYKKPRKKKKGRDSTVYSTMKQQSLSGFISLHNDLY